MNERISKAFWLWGQFDPQTTNTLKKIKEETLASLGGPIFEEHITISGPLKKNYKKLTKRTKKINFKQNMSC